MTTDITKLNLQIYKPDAEVKTELNGSVVEEEISSDEQWFLTITSRFAPVGYALMKFDTVEDEDVLDGTVSEEIEKLENEQEQINSILNANTQNTVNSIVSENVKSTQAKTIGFDTYSSGQTINSKTDTTSILNNIQYSNNEEKQVVEGAIQVMVDWLDDYITNYSTRVSEGVARGDSEVKLSFLLELRKAIENCDFPIGFGDYSGEDDEYTLGSYSFILGGYDDYYHLNTSRSILLNAKYLMPERTYTSYQEIENAILADPNTKFYCTDLVFASDEGYYNYCTNYMASVLIHEFTHSLHIYNEAVTYYVNDCFDDDFYNQAVEGLDYNFIDTYFISEVITYGDLGISHELNSFEEAVAHGHENNMDYEKLYVDKGFTINDDRNELLNFVYYTA